jgi:hypothetical protein
MLHSLSYLEKRAVAPCPVCELVAATHAEVPPRLFLPPIQRSLVWRNEQILNYWDSLLRGYPPGMMMVHKITKQSRVTPLQAGADSAFATEYDWQLFDGQQRTAAIQLGFGEGKLSKSLRLWVDFDKSVGTGGRRFQLLVSSTGQPFGYRAAAPNEKLALFDRRKAWSTWLNARLAEDATEVERVACRERAFAEAKGTDIQGGGCIVPLGPVLAAFREGGHDVARNAIADAGAASETVEHFLDALEVAMKADIIFVKVPDTVVSDPDSYVRFFGRVGQGGTRLSDDELTYSIIKKHYEREPLRERIENIAMDKEIGRLIGEVDLVLAAMRIARVAEMDKDLPEWEIISRPTPAFVSRLPTDGKQQEDTDRKKVVSLGRVDKRFRKLVIEPVATDEASELAGALRVIRRALVDGGFGFPPMLLGRLPSELIDVLLLFVLQPNGVDRGSEEDAAILRAFALWWLAFVGDDNYVAYRAYRAVMNDPESAWSATLPALIRDTVDDGRARRVPSTRDIEAMRSEVTKGSPMLRAWEKRFAEADVDSYKPGDAVRVLSTHRGIIGNVLAWLQRGYLGERFGDYDPTSGRDEDLPVDLDHIIPHSHFGFHGNSMHNYTELDDDDLRTAFARERSVVGNSLGNFRWLCASDNRARGAVREVDSAPIAATDHVPEADKQAWESLIKIRSSGDGDGRWRAEHVRAFQRLIDLRTLHLLELFIADSGIATILPPDDCPI